MKKAIYAAGILLLLINVSILPGCGSSSTGTPTPTPTPTPSGPLSNTPPPNGNGKYNPQSYAGKPVTTSDLQGLWMMAGTDDMAITDLQTGESDSGTGQRREIFALRRNSNLAKIDIKFCGSNQWLTIDKGIPSLSSFSVADTTYNPVSNNQIDVSRVYDLSDADHSSFLTGTYTAYKISDDPEQLAGTLTLSALVTDFNSPSLNQNLIANNTTLPVYCFIESEYPVATGIPDFKDTHFLQAYYNNDVAMFSIINFNTTSTPSFLVLFEYLTDDFGAIGGPDLIQLDYKKSNPTSLDMNFNADTVPFNGVPDNANGRVVLSF